MATVSVAIVSIACVTRRDAAEAIVSIAIVSMATVSVAIVSIACVTRKDAAEARESTSPPFFHLALETVLTLVGVITR